IGSIDSLTEDDFAAGLYTAGQPEVDLIIRTSGEYRVSNFLLWQSAYAEYVFPEALWPDFTPAHFDDALAQYSLRRRRKGAIE
ncbi:MAG: undecaprenyl diphosphate synthase family protein, partial [Oscillospiraceae bacterium]|nr:undecaprenyl diphosphate synthase family protein [Oscillospiraceae bacterium]